MARVDEIFARLARWPGGRWLFSRLVSFKAPYFGSIGACFVELAPGRAVVRLPNRRAVRNHLGTVHAIAMCNAAELAAGTLMEASLPAGLRWIPRGMQVSYLRKATTDVVATAILSPLPVDGHTGDVEVVVELRDAGGELACLAKIAMYVSPRRRPAGA